MRARLWRPVVLGLVLMPLAACQTVGTKEAGEGAAIEDRTTAAGVEGDAARTRALAGGPAGTFQGRSIDDPASPISRRVFYFDYDSDEIREEYKPILEAHAAYLTEQRGVNATLEGHADERGSREYNLALGERRGQTVRRVMTILGAAAGQVGVVSFGEERPAVEGHDESAYAENRRVELVYRAR